MGQCDIFVVTLVSLVVVLIEASNNPCDPSTAECSGGVCCKGCFFQQEGTLCRRKISSCDVPEYCTGKENHCPRNTFLPDGISCGDGENSCHQGLCLGKIFDSEDVIGKKVEKTLKNGKQSEEIAASFSNPKETRQTRNTPKIPESAIKSDPPKVKNTLLVPFIVVIVTALIMLIMCVRTCVGFYRERDMRYRLRKAKVAVEPGNIQTYNSIIEDVSVHYDVAMPTMYHSLDHQTGQRKKQQKKKTSQSNHYYASQSELDPVPEENSHQLEQRVFDQIKQGVNGLEEHYKNQQSGEINAQTTDQSGLKPNFQLQRSQSDHSKEGRMLNQSEKSEPGRLVVGNISQSEHIQPGRPETCIDTKLEQNQYHQLKVYSSIQSQQNKPDQMEVYSSMQSQQNKPDRFEVHSSIKSEQNKPDQLEVYSSIQSEQCKPDQLELYSSIHSQPNKPDQFEVYSSIQLEPSKLDQFGVYSSIQSEPSKPDQFGVYSSIQSEPNKPDQFEVYSIQSEQDQNDAAQSEQFLAGQTHETLRNYYQPLTSFEGLTEQDPRYQQLTFAQPSSSEENK